MIGNGISIGVTDGTSFGGTYSQNGGTNSGCYQIAKASYGYAVGVAHNGNSFQNGKMIGITTEADKSGIICEKDTQISMIIKY